MGLDRSNMPPTCNIMDHTSTNIALIKDSGSHPTNNVASFFNNNNNSQSQMQPVPVKCVLLGDGAVGKTSMIVSYTTNGYPTEYVPTAFDNFSVIVKVDGRSVQLQLCDTAGQDDFDALRPLCYPCTDVFVLCFSVVSPTSFHNILEKWVPEVRTHGKKASVILVGTQCDLRNDVKILIELARYKEKPVCESEAKALSDQIGALAYIECSALTQKNLKDVFDLALMASLNLTPDVKPLKRSKKSKVDIPERSSRTSINSAITATPCQSQCPSRTSRDLTVDKKKGWKRFCCFLS